MKTHPCDHELELVGGQLAFDHLSVQADHGLVLSKDTMDVREIVPFSQLPVHSDDDSIK